MGFIQFIFFWIHIALMEGGKKRGKLGECSNYEYTRMLLCFAELQSLMIAAIPNIIGWLAISFAKVSERR
jgi:hypothetical protein